jgi:hypothetical protein
MSQGLFWFFAMAEHSVLAIERILLELKGHVWGNPLLKNAVILRLAGALEQVECFYGK